MRFATSRIASASLVVAGCVGLSPCLVAEQRGAPARKPLPQGERIEARDGDVVAIEDDARVRMVRRRQVIARTIFNPTEKLLLVLLDYASPAAPDGRVDMRYAFTRVSGEWPLGERWEGRGVVEEYQAFGAPGQGMGLLLPQGLVQILSLSGEDFKDPSALGSVTFGGANSGIANGADFDEAERRQLADLARSNGARGGLSVVAPREPGFGSTASVSLSVRPKPEARVGNTVRTPTKLRGIQPTFPPNWPVGDRNQFVMVLMSVGTDGAVTDVKVLRSVPGLDEAAIAAASQWRYAPELFDGHVTTYTVTAPVIFKP